MKKLSALTGLDPDKLSDFFDIQDLEAETWNNIEGLEAYPAFSPHPVETTILFFRTLWEQGWKTYGHLADIPTLDVLKGMVTDDRSKNGLSAASFQKARQRLLTPVDLKKIDIGGGLIHGSAEDFEEDNSKKILLSHTAEVLTPRQKEIGESTVFGMVDILIPADQDYSKSFAYRQMRVLHPTVPDYELRMLLNCPTVRYNPGSILIKRGETNLQHIFFVLSGVAEHIVSEVGTEKKLLSGSMVGEFSCILNRQTQGTYRALTSLKTVRLPSGLYLEFLNRNGIYEATVESTEKRGYLQDSWLFGDYISCPIRNAVARQMQMLVVDEGTYLPENEPDLFMLDHGEIDVLADGRSIETLDEPGDFFGEERILLGNGGRLKAFTKTRTVLWRIPAEVFREIPIVKWKLIETYDYRMKILRTL